MTLVSLAEIKDFLVIKTANTDEDGRLSNIASHVSSLIASYCGRQFESALYTEYYDGGTSAVFIKNPPINYIAEVSQFTGSEYTILGAPGESGQPITSDGQNHTISYIGSPYITTRIKQFGTSSGRFSNNDALVVPYSYDFDLSDLDFTVEAFVRLNTQTQLKIANSSNSNSSWEFGYDGANTSLYFKNILNGVENISISNTYAISGRSFTHIAVSRDANNIYLLANGNVITYLNTANSISDTGTELHIGSGLDGYLDNFMLSHESKYSNTYSVTGYTIPVLDTTKLAIRFDGTDRSTTFIDSSRTVNEYSFYKETGEISFNTGEGGGTSELSFFRPLKSSNYPNGVKVIYNGGFDNIPDDLKLAALELIKVIYKGRSGSEVSRFQGEYSEAFKLSIDDFPPQVRRVLNLYRLVS